MKILNIEQIKNFLIWYGYRNPKLALEQDGTYFFRVDDWVVKVYFKEDSIVVEQDREYFYEYYPMDFYNFEFECSFIIDEIKNEINVG